MSNPETTSQAVIDELISLATSHANLAIEARKAGLRDEAKLLQRSANAFVGALDEYNQGVRPQQLRGGAYLLPSRSNGPAHLVTCDGDWRCTCASGDQVHWASALVQAVAAVAEREIARAQLLATLSRERSRALAQQASDDLFGSR